MTDNASRNQIRALLGKITLKPRNGELLAHPISDRSLPDLDCAVMQTAFPGSCLP